jgi:hypothetical protein
MKKYFMMILIKLVWALSMLIPFIYSWLNFIKFDLIKQKWVI